jgi:CHAD domain
VVKAKRVKGLDCDDPVVENARRIIATRLDELLSFEQYVDDPVNVIEIHNMRIAAKRLRYTLELFQFAFPAGLGKLIDEVKTIQEHIGSMHDADVMRVRAIETLNNDAIGRTIRLIEIASAVERGTIAQRHQRLRSAMTNKTTPRDEVALLTLVAHCADDELSSYGAFHRAWQGMADTDFPGRLRRFTGIDSQEVAIDPAPASGEVPPM